MLRIKEQETRLTLQEHDDDDDQLPFAVGFFNVFTQSAQPKVQIHGGVWWKGTNASCQIK